ncbi:energy-coupling factor transporter transmembrane component T family protein [Mycoplasmopsis glycophila]|uniref:Energy-coupling factor transporter transmembrane protein EcfT n=1 Tax=Mycoplasmopsis glycophila TaxID=171285 RepID=A0A449AU52_9BACT|nr:energy-coupling factor transporter transmembrane component T [Mycoplasmopsis glycophila]VEU70012.1 Energy-coupling factor transporter transmembrane protein EcfT [Mycoplasmopsis glycophila]
MNSIFGRYIPGNQFIYKIDPRLKLLITLVYIILVFFVSSFFDILILLVPLILIHIFVTKRPRNTFRMMKLPLVITIVIFLINIYTLDLKAVVEYNYFPTHFVPFFASKGTIIEQTANQAKINQLVHIYKKLNLSYPEIANLSSETAGFKNYVGISWLSANRSLALFFRIYTMILVMSILTNTTRPILLTKSIEDVLYPFKLIKLPVHIVAMIISIALRFIPTLLDESSRIMKAQSSRGVDFKNGKLKDKIVAFTTLIIPLFVSSFAKAEDLSNSMETRGYDPYQSRTKYRLLKFQWFDFVVVLVILLLITYMVVSIYFWRHYEWTAKLLDLSNSAKTILLYFKIV